MRLRMSRLAALYGLAGAVACSNGTGIGPALAGTYHMTLYRGHTLPAFDAVSSVQIVGGTYTLKATRYISGTYTEVWQYALNNGTDRPVTVDSGNWQEMGADVTSGATLVLSVPSGVPRSAQIRVLNGTLYTEDGTQYQR